MKLIELDPDEVEWEDWAKRSMLDEGFIDELARSIKEHGQASPIRVRVVGGRYVGVSGYQRWLACKRAGVKVRAEVVELDDKAAALSHLEENAYRDDLHPLDLARKVDYALRAGATVEEVERACRKDVTKLRFLLDLPLKVQEYVRGLPREKVPYTKLYELKPLLGRVGEDELLGWVDWIVKFNPTREEVARRVRGRLERPSDSEGVELEEAASEGAVKRLAKRGEVVPTEVGLTPLKAEEAGGLKEVEERASPEGEMEAEDALAMFREASMRLAEYARRSPTAARRAVEVFEEVAETLISCELFAVMDREKRDRVLNALLRAAGKAKHDYCPLCYGELKGDLVAVHVGCLERARGL